MLAVLAGGLGHTPGPDLLHARIVEPPGSEAQLGLGHVHVHVSLVGGGHGCEALPKLPRPLCVLL
jgi:hypothetical protein